MSAWEKIRTYVQQHGPCGSDDVAKGTDLDRPIVIRALCRMCQLKQMRRPARGQYEFVRDAIPVDERMRRAREAYNANREQSAPDAERLRKRRYWQQHSGEINARKRARRAALPKRVREPKPRKLAVARAAVAPAPVVERIPRIPKPKPLRPEQVRVKRSKLTNDAVAAPSAMKIAPPDMAGFPDTQAWMDANPDKVERLPHGAISRPETLSAQDRASIRSMK